MCLFLFWLLNHNYLLALTKKSVSVCCHLTLSDDGVPLKELLHHDLLALTGNLNTNAQIASLHIFKKKKRKEKLTMCKLFASSFKTIQKWVYTATMCQKMITAGQSVYRQLRLTTMSVIMSSSIASWTRSLQREREEEEGQRPVFSQSDGRWVLGQTGTCTGSWWASRCSSPAAAASGLLLLYCSDPLGGRWTAALPPETQQTGGQ